MVRGLQRVEAGLFAPDSQLQPGGGVGGPGPQGEDRGHPPTLTPASIGREGFSAQSLRRHQPVADGYWWIMSDQSPEQFAEFTTQDGPGSADIDRPDNDQRHPAQEHPAQEAHGGSMAPGLVDPTGHQVADPPPGR